MARHKRKLTLQEKAAKRRRKRETMTIFINGKQKRVKRSPTIDGLSVDEFILRNADPVWLAQNEMWEYLDPGPEAPPERPDIPLDGCPSDDETVPF